MSFTKNNPIKVEFLDDKPGLIKLLQDIIFVDNEGRNCTYKVFIAPKGMESDGASVPRVFRSAFSVFGFYLKAVILHDFISQKGIPSRKEGDALFKRAMASLDKHSNSRNKLLGWSKRNLMFRAVRAGGWMIWRKRHGKKKK